jgi:hypothetical protein
MQNKKWVLMGVGVLVLVIVGFLVLMNQNKPTDEANSESVLPQSEKMEMVESSVKVAVKRSIDGKKAILNISGIPSKYEDIDYEFTYDTKGGVPRGVLGVLEVANGAVEKEIVLGSCSTNVCTYDEGVEKVTVNLKFNSPSESRVFEKQISL